MDLQVTQAVIDGLKQKWPNAELIQLTAKLKSGEVYEVIAKIPQGGEAQMFRDTIQTGPQGKGRSVVAFVPLLHPVA